ncbi:Uncharacterised protein g5782 [Pycnogonum litorale]
MFFYKILDEITTFGQTLNNCIGFASDGAASMVGCNNSVWSRIKSESPNCVQMKCICHSLSLCIEHAVSKLSSNAGFLLTEVALWFSNSRLRREDFKALFQVMNPADGENSRERDVPLPFQKLSKTRWLIRGKILYNILMNWEELLAYFSSCEAKLSINARYKCRLIKEMLADRINYLYFVFATPVVQEFKKINSLFQQTNGDPHELSRQLVMHHENLYRRLYNQNAACKILENVDFGAKFNQEISIHMVNSTSGSQNEEKCKIKEVKLRCQAMLQEALSQVEKRLPESANMFKGLSLLNPNKVLSQTLRGKFEDLPFPHLMESDGVIEEQYRKVGLVEWCEECFAGSGIPKDSLKFWQGVAKHNNFKELATYALTSLITPASNATVERIFSLVTAIKTKPRNKTQIKLLDAIVRIRSHLIDNGICCRL